ncbi:unnamed protein product [Cunninghamella echinulata]
MQIISLMNSQLESTSDSDEDFIFPTKKTQQQHHYHHHHQQHPQSSQSQPQRSVDNSLKSNNKQVEDSSQLFSQGGASEITTLTTSLHPSMDSNIDPSPRSSLDAIESTTQDLSLPYMNAPTTTTTTTTAPRTSIEMNHHRYTKSSSSNIYSSPPVPLSKTTNNISSSSSSSPSNTLFHTNNNYNNSTGLPLYSRYRKQSNVSMIPSNINNESFQNTPSLPLPPPPPSQQQQQKRLQIIPGKSLLTAMIAAKATTAENPFSTYSHASGKGSNRPLTLRIYLPHTDTPKEPITLIVRPDVIIDDVIGYILYDYIEQKRQPELEDEVYDLAQWSLLIVEDDGEVDDELPAMDRTRRIDKVGFDEFALCRATPSQAKQNEQVRAKLGRFGPDIESLKKKPSIPTAINMNGPTSSKMDNNNNINNNNNNNINQVNNNNNNNNNTLLQPSSSKKMSGSTNYSTSGNGDNTNNILESSAQSGSQLQLDMEMMAASTMNTNLNIPTTTSTTDAVADSSSIAVPVPSSKSVLTKAALPITPIKYFRIRLMTNDEVAATTTIPVYAEMFIGDVLELVSRKRKLDPNDYMLTMSDSNLVVRNDTAVEDLKDVDELALRKKGSTLSIPTSSNHLWRSPIKKKKEESHQPMYFTTNDHSNQPSDNFLQQYKKYNINRKTPMFVGKKISILAIDGNYIHLMPPEHKGGMFDSLKTTSFHVGAIKFCKQSKKVPSNFKIGVMKERDFKTYELEAETSKEAYEICARIKFLIQMNKGSGT